MFKFDSMHGVLGFRPYFDFFHVFDNIEIICGYFISYDKSRLIFFCSKIMPRAYHKSMPLFKYEKINEKLFVVLLGLFDKKAGITVFGGRLLV